MKSKSNAILMDKVCHLNKFGITVDKRSAQTFEWENHWHNCWEIELIIKGSGYQLLNGKKTQISKGCAYILNPTDFHEVHFEDVVLYSIALPDELLPQEFLSEFSGTSGDKYCRLNEKTLDKLEQIFDSLVSEVNDTPAYCYRTIALLVKLMAYELLRAFKKPEQTRSSHITLVGKAVSYINNHFCDNPSLSDTASYLGITPSYLSELFHSETGKKYKEYLNETRLNYAKRLLETTNLSVTEICFASGFSSLSNFMRAFKVAFGCSPQKHKSESDTAIM